MSCQAIVILYRLSALFSYKAIKIGLWFYLIILISIYYANNSIKA